MKKEPLVSVIIPTYNRAHLIGETLDSVLAQTYQNWECIIVDDGSSDDTDEVVGGYVKKDSRFKYFHRPEEHLPGGNGARNYGFKMSQGEYIQWFDSDDIMLPKNLELKINAMEDCIIEFVFCDFELFDENRTYATQKIASISGEIIDSFLSKQVGIATPQPLIKKSVLEKHKIQFDEQLKRGQELLYYAQLLFYIKVHSYIDQVLFQYRFDVNSTTDNFKSSKLKYLLEAHLKTYFLVNSKGDKELLKKFYNSRLKKYLIGALRNNKELFFKVIFELMNNTYFYRFKFIKLYFMGRALSVLDKTNAEFYKQKLHIN